MQVAESDSDAWQINAHNTELFLRNKNKFENTIDKMQIMIMKWHIYMIYSILPL